MGAHVSFYTRRVASTRTRPGRIRMMPTGKQLSSVCVCVCNYMCMCMCVCVCSLPPSFPPSLPPSLPPCVVVVWCDLMTQTLMAETPIGSPSGVCALSLPAPSRTPWRRAAQMREAGYGCIVINVINCDKGSAGFARWLHAAEFFRLS